MHFRFSFWIRLISVDRLFKIFGVCKVFVTVDVNSSEKPVLYCRAGSLCPAIPCPVRQRAGTENPPLQWLVRSYDKIFTHPCPFTLTKTITYVKVMLLI